ncbi:VanZ family protein [bacterium]|nr:VanZ family protein [bacterium]
MTPSVTRKTQILFYWLPFIAYSLLIIYLSHQPHIDLGVDVGDKWLHFVEYFGYALLLIRILLLYTIPYYGALTIGISTLYGISDELHQFFIPGRDCSISDVLVDIIGALTIVLGYRVIKRFKQR